MSRATLTLTFHDKILHASPPNRPKMRIYAKVRSRYNLTQQSAAELAGVIFKARPTIYVAPTGEIDTPHNP